MNRKTHSGNTSAAHTSDLSPSKTYSLDVLGLFQADAGDIAASRVRSQFIHRGGNIRSAGDEVEKAVRLYFERRLPRGYTVHHGHFLDASLALTPQLDIIIADGGKFPVFFRGQDGIEYLPYEGVYAFGEIKSALTNKDVRDFIVRVRDIRSRLIRSPVPDGYVDQFELDDRGEMIVQPWAERGDLYRFMFGVSSEGLDFDACLKIYARQM